MSTFRTRVVVHLWPTNEIDLTSAIPSFQWKGEEIDIDYMVRMTKDREEVEVTLWNIGEPERLAQIFKEGFLIALDLARIDTPGALTHASLHRVVLARIKDARIGDDNPEAGDIPYKIRASPITETLRETVIRAHFDARTGPYYLSDVVAELLKKAGVGAVQVDIEDRYRLDNFTCDDPIWTAIKRAAGKAGTAVAIWLTGGMVRVSTRFTGLTVLDDDDIFDAGREEQNQTMAPQPIIPKEFQIAGETYSLPEQYQDSDEETQIALDEAPVNAGYKIELPISPNLFKGGVVVVQKGFALNRMGFFGADLQSFNIVGLEHSGSSYDGADVDTTIIYTALRQEPLEVTS